MSSARDLKPLGWAGIVRLGLVQAALGSVVVFVISTLNRVMVVEYAWPALLPGSLVALHYIVQFMRTRFGYRADQGGRITPWILGGMAILAGGGVLCALATVLLPLAPYVAVPLAVLAYVLVGFGVSASGTSLLVLVAARAGSARRAGAAAVIWILMIAGFAGTSSVVGHFLDPFSPRRLMAIAAVIAISAFALGFAAVWGVEGPAAPVRSLATPGKRRLIASLESAWRDPPVRIFTQFVLISMLAYSAQELLFEPFAGLVFGLTLGASAKLAGLWHGSVLIGMILVGIACRGRWHDAALRACTVGGCAASAAAVAALAAAALIGPGWPLPASVIALGLSNGVFAVSAVGSMMMLAHRVGSESAGLRMGLWGTAQAVGFAGGGLLATLLLDVCRRLLGAPGRAFAVVFTLEAALFVAAAGLALRSQTRREPGTSLAAVARP